jgi:DNA topoisomerase-1
MSTRIAEPPHVHDLAHDLALAAAKAVGLRHVNDTGPGITRRRAGKSFYYLAVDGTRIRDEATLVRIRKLAIPPAYVRVWICPRADGHLQATGYDAFGRKQYRYHPQWQAIRSTNKFSHMIEFATALPKLRRQVDRDLRRDGLDRQRVLATAVRVLDTTLIRVGNERYTQQHGSYGLTTLQNRHVDIKGAHLYFHFVGKSKQSRELHVDDPTLARIVRRCRDLPGHRLFEYKDAAGEVQTIDSSDVNAYLHTVTGQELTAKDFRTWGGTVHAAVTLARMGPADSATASERNIVQAVKEVAARLGNKPATSRKYYIHPAVLDAYRDGSLMRHMQPNADPTRPPPRAGLKAEEKAVLALLAEAADRARKLAAAPRGRAAEVAIKSASKPVRDRTAASKRKPASKPNRPRPIAAASKGGARKPAAAPVRRAA